MHRHSIVPKIKLGDETIFEQTRKSSDFHDTRSMEFIEPKKKDDTDHIRKLILSTAQILPEANLLWKFPWGLDAFSFRKDKDAEILFSKHRCPLHKVGSDIGTLKRYRESINQDKMSADFTPMRRSSRLSSVASIRSHVRDTGALPFVVSITSKSATVIPSGTSVEEEVSQLKLPTVKELTRLKFKLPRVLSRQGALVPIPWFLERLSESCRSCRFGLPIDLKMLERMTVSHYLLGYCNISQNRQIVYRKCFNKHKPKNSDTLSLQTFETALRVILLNSISKTDIFALFKALEINNTTKIDLKFFSVVCAVAERILYSSYAGIYNTIDVSQGNLEYADFSALKWKLEGIKIDPHLMRLLISLG